MKAIPFREVAGVGFYLKYVNIPCLTLNSVHKVEMCPWSTYDIIHCNAWEGVIPISLFLNGIALTVIGTKERYMEYSGPSILRPAIERVSMWSFLYMYSITGDVKLYYPDYGNCHQWLYEVQW